MYMSDAPVIVYQISKVEVYWQNQLLLFGIDTVYFTNTAVIANEILTRAALVVCQFFLLSTIKCHF